MQILEDLESLERIESLESLESLERIESPNKEFHEELHPLVFLQQ